MYRKTTTLLLILLTTLICAEFTPAQIERIESDPKASAIYKEAQAKGFHYISLEQYTYLHDTAGETPEQKSNRLKAQQKEAFETRIQNQVNAIKTPPPEQKSYYLNGDIYDIPRDINKKFLTDHPDAVELSPEEIHTATHNLRQNLYEQHSTKNKSISETSTKPYQQSIMGALRQQRIQNQFQQRKRDRSIFIGVIITFLLLNAALFPIYFYKKNRIPFLMGKLNAILFLLIFFNTPPFGVAYFVYLPLAFYLCCEGYYFMTKGRDNPTKDKLGALFAFLGIAYANARGLEFAHELWTIINLLTMLFVTALMFRQAYTTLKMKRNLQNKI